MKILLVGYWFGCCVGRHFYKAFKQLGHDTIAAGTTWGNYIPWAGGTMLSTSFIPDMIMHQTAIPTYRAICEYVGSDFDFVLHFDPHMVISDAPVPKILYAPDCHVRDYDPGKFDLVFGAHSWGIHSDAENFRWLPLGYDPDECYDKQLDRPIDVGMIGCVYERRLEAIKLLLRKNITLLTAWGRSGEEWNDLYNMVKMALVVTHSGDLSDRLFANMAQGCLVLADRGIVDLGKLGAKEGIHYLAFGSDWELIEQIQRGCDDVYRGVIVTWAKDWVKKHTWQARVIEMLDIVGVLLG
jgi:hypothetical protein